jgi:CheY-like chemotaxis protein
MAPENKPKVVVVEDDPKLRRFLEVLLSAESYAVHCAGDGEEGLELVRRVRPVLILSDIMMPKMDGFELLRRIRIDPATAAIPLIFLTAKASVDERVAGLKLGADDYIVKPFAPAELGSRVKAVLRRSTLKATEPELHPKRQPPRSCAAGRGLIAAEMFTQSPQVLLAGQLSAVTLIDVLQSISWSGVSGRLEICGNDHGVLELRNGQLIHAEVTTKRKTIQGLKAWFRLAYWTEGLFEFLGVDKAEAPPPRTIETPLQTLLMDAAYYRDEVLRVRGMFPPLNFELVRREPPRPSAALVDHAIWQAVGDGIGLEALLDGLDYSDLEILQRAFQLMVDGQLGLKLAAG